MEDQPSDKVPLEGIVASVQLASVIQGDERARAEERDLSNEEHSLHLQALRQDLEERKRYAVLIFRLVVGWLIFVALVILLQGFLGPHRWFQVSDPVLLAMFGTTTVNVIGTLFVVANYLFPNKPPVLNLKRKTGPES
jgi:uncharacterized membrane protein YhdT